MVNTKWTIGNFAISLSADLTDEQKALAEGFGLRWAGQRNSEVDKILGGFRTNGAGKAERIPGFKRNDVPYDAELAQKLAESFETLVFPGEGESEAMEVVAIAEITEYEREAGASKFAAERAKYSEKKTAADRQALADKVGYTGELGDGSAENASDAFLRAIRDYVKSLAKGL